MHTSIGTENESRMQMSRQQYARKHGVNRTQDMAKQTFAHLSSGP